MRYRVTAEISEIDLKKLYNYTRIIPLYREDVQQSDLDFIERNFKNGVICEELYAEYSSTFQNDIVLKKGKFYDTVRQFTGAKCEVKRQANGSIKNCFLV